MDGRDVTLVLCRAGTVVGALPPLRVEEPWWRSVDDVVVAARAEFGVDPTILRLLTCPGWGLPAGGRVAYLAEVDRPPGVPLRPWNGPDPLLERPHRMPYARPGGPAADLDWARSELGRHGVAVVGPARQIRTWNLSSIWLLPTEVGHTWLKVVPPFLGHEPRILEALSGAAVPRLIAGGEGRSLLADVPGDDQYDAPRASLMAMVRELVGLQTGWIGRTDDLLALGLPDLRAEVLIARIEQVVELHRAELEPGEATTVDALVSGLAERLAAVAACGVPDTLVHGDFHPGNVRGRPGAFTILDWGDSGVGNPLLDQLAFGERLSPSDRAAVEELWAALWREAVPGCRAEEAAALLRPAAALVAATAFQRFLDNIEPDERPYHEGDPAVWLRRAASAGIASGS